MAEKKKKEMDSKKKEGLFFGGAIIVILAISILTSNVNMMDEISGFVKGIWNKAQEAVKESGEVKTLSKGAHVEIKSTQVIHLREIYEAMGEEMDESQAIAILQEVKTLAYYGNKQGVLVTDKELEAYINEIKEKLKEDESGYRRLVNRYGDEDEYWTILKNEVKEYIVFEKMKEEKREELNNKRDVDVETELQAYIDEMVGYENFN